MESTNAASLRSAFWFVGKPYLTGLWKVCPSAGSNRRSLPSSRLPVPRSASSEGRVEGRLIANWLSEHWSIAMTTIQSSGIEPGQRRLNGPQTTGRNYRNLSQPACAMTRDDDVAVPMRDGVALLADVHRPTEPGRYPVLVAASPYPRQIQNLGAPAGFIEAAPPTSSFRAAMCMSSRTAEAPAVPAAPSAFLTVRNAATCTT